MTINGIATVLVVDDEESFAEALSIGLTREGFQVELARDGIQALDRFDAVRPELVVLDIMLPRLSGLDVCRQIRRRSGVPIVMVSAKTSEVDTVVGLEVGADDYVSKPYRLRELTARLRAALRRAPPTEGAEDSPGVLAVGDLRLDPDRHEVFLGGKGVTLPLKEFELLRILMANAGRVLTREVLIDRIWGHDYVGDSKTLDVHVKRLRSRIEVDPSSPVLLTTVRGLGYKFNVGPETPNT
jgi:two-component system, OmpR family, response regulator RegX3